MSWPYFFDGSVLSIAASRCPRSECRHLSAASRSSSALKVPRARVALMGRVFRSSLGRRSRWEDSPCAASLAAASAASFPGMSQWPGTQRSVSLRPQRYALRERSFLWKTSVRYRPGPGAREVEACIATMLSRAMEASALQADSARRSSKPKMVATTSASYTV